ncbi:MAG: glucose-6-phosphate isomerase, partial [Candidatus Adiutrix sp.]
MAEQFLDLTHAFKHRLLGVDILKSPAMQRAEEMSKRLCEGLALGNLPFLNLAFKEQLEEALPRVMQGFKDKKQMLLLGIGGSALGARVLQKAFARGQDCPSHHGKSLWIADNIDVELFDVWLKNLPAKETIVAVVSKSGTTIETMAQFFLVQKWLQENLPTTWQEHLIFITDENKGSLRDFACKEGIKTLPVPDNLGGRYSIFSAVGMLPAAFLNIDYKALLEGACSFGEQTLNNIENFQHNPAMQLAVWNYELLSRGYSELIFFSYIPAWQPLGNWFAQLWAESLGKDGRGSAPFPAAGVTDQHSINQMFLVGQRNKACIFLSSANLAAGARFPAN